MSTILSNRVQKIKPSATIAVSEKAKQLKVQRSANRFHGFR